MKQKLNFLFIYLSICQLEGSSMIEPAKEPGKHFIYFYCFLAVDQWNPESLKRPYPESILSHFPHSVIAPKHSMVTQQELKSSKIFWAIGPNLTSFKTLERMHLWKISHSPGWCLCTKGTKFIWQWTHGVQNFWQRTIILCILMVNC